MNSLSTKKIQIFIVIVLIILGVIGTIDWRVSLLEKAHETYQTILSGGIASAPNHDIQPVSNTDYIRGNKYAPVTIVEYTDFECPSCQIFQPTMQKLHQQYADKLKWVYRSFPLPQHANAQKEAQAAMCAGHLGGNNAFWKFSDALFAKMIPTEDGTGFSVQKLPNLAKAIGIDEKQFQSCLDKHIFQSEVAAQIADAKQSGANQLPTVFIFTKDTKPIMLSGNQSLVVMQTIINQLL